MHRSKSELRLGPERTKIDLINGGAADAYREAIHQLVSEDPLAPYCDASYGLEILRILVACDEQLRVLEATDVRHIPLAEDRRKALVQKREERLSTEQSRAQSGNIFTSS